MTKNNTTQYRWVKETLDNSMEALRYALDNEIAKLNETIESISELKLEEESSTERISFENYKNDCTHKLQEYANLLMQIMEKTL